LPTAEAAGNVPASPIAVSTSAVTIAAAIAVVTPAPTSAIPPAADHDSAVGIGARIVRIVAAGMSFTLRRIPENALFGIKTLWRGQARVPIADKHRTIVDLLADPATGGGIRHVEHCLRNYLRDPEANADTLIGYSERLGNGAVFKRLGFLVSQISGDEALAESCRQRLTQGNAKLDPALPSRRLVKTWRLWIPKTWKAKGGRD